MVDASLEQLDDTNPSNSIQDVHAKERETRHSISDASEIIIAYEDLTCTCSDSKIAGENELINATNNTEENNNCYGPAECSPGVGFLDNSTKVSLRVKPNLSDEVLANGDIVEKNHNKVLAGASSEDATENSNQVRDAVSSVPQVTALLDGFAQSSNEEVSLCLVSSLTENVDNIEKEADKVMIGASSKDPLKENMDQKRETTSSVSQVTALPDGRAQVNSEDVILPFGRSLTRSQKKLLVLDVNGILADILSYEPEGFQADIVISRKAVFKRPFVDEFLQFCFQNFEVGIWSSRTKRNVGLVLDFLLRDARNKLAFCWDQSHCTDTGYTVVGNNDKPLLVKKLAKLWNKCERGLPWKRGEYNKSNTLLLDDSPYKALCNPPNTAIFPYSFEYKDNKDKCLGPGGKLRVYLQRLANAEDVQKFVERNPFGQRPIAERNGYWHFYRQVHAAASSIPDDKPDTAATLL